MRGEMLVIRHVVLLILLLAVAHGASAAEEPVASFEAVYAAAASALAEAEARRNVWSKTDGLLKAAKKAHDDGQDEEAIRLATEAKLQAELAVAQAKREKEAWRGNVLSQ